MKETANGKSTSATPLSLGQTIGAVVGALLAMAFIVLVLLALG